MKKKRQQIPTSAPDKNDTHPVKQPEYELEAIEYLIAFMPDARFESIGEIISKRINALKSESKCPKGKSNELLNNYIKLMRVYDSAHRKISSNSININ